ncbi:MULTISPECIES: TetR/AcrR family transcriptional regulator [unclassified Streptomyces]|uniref:TetR/AcrR family transcriptional regulator n=1 Tax=unclassified Streptomyces TaxID=2593676 RepID=UPI0029BA9B0E|nr:MULTISPECIES: TetR family transcriptional regulator C-terminal domain-containing protein [unclassified Streptomyces]MDX3770691.1 TetR family transcriptional regulator C-terminal domain-containing protein [Streptomyces sp. AK08-01B]MDX3819165.1 TetR family transcriptional regulator C-terminal domain-containing protein [Streptomyces sp. AK08-01A]
MARQSMREEIVDAAVAQFHSKGYNAAGVKDITDAAGTPKGSFYNHFDSKESLAVVALERYGASRRLQDLAASDIAPLVRLRKHFEFLRDETVDAGFARGCLIGNFGAEVADHSETIRTGVRESLGHWASMISGALVEAQQAGTVRADLDPEKTARFLLNAWEGTLIAARSSRSGDAFDDFFDTAFGALLAPHPEQAQP